MAFRAAAFEVIAVALEVKGGTALAVAFVGRVALVVAFEVKGVTALVVAFLLAFLLALLVLEMKLTNFGLDCFIATILGTS